ncbi:MAG: nitronate monooxygenase [Solirubrobacterales bacterium]|nr:nitronate monooxygenase [Solirubrobacterales bacterium]
MSTRLTGAFGLEHPILSAPMAVAAGGWLAAAVSSAGGLGLVGGAYVDRDWIAAELDEAGDTPVGCGFITWALERSPDVLDLVLERRPRAVMLSFGDPRPLGARVRDAGVPLICQVNSRPDALLALEAGADVVVAQGAEAGGHGAHHRSTLTLVPELADLLADRSPDTLLCAAGGIADGRGLAAALMLGADGVLIGSRLWATTEAKVPTGLHDAALAADGDATTLSRALDIARGLPWPDRFSCRVLRNRFSETWDGREAELRDAGHTVGEDWKRAFVAGDPDASNTIVGEAVGLIHGVQPAADVIERIVAEATTLLGAHGTAASALRETDRGVDG